VKGRRILVVEDEYPVAEELRRWLQDGGAEVIGPASRVGRARSLIASETIDAAVLDIHLAGELVFPAAEALDERKIPYLFLSGFSRATIPARFAHVPLLEKPVFFNDLYQALAVILGG